MFLNGEKGHLQCPPVEKERERLALLLYNSLDLSGICTVCHSKLTGKKKEKCSCSLESSTEADAAETLTEMVAEAETPTKTVASPHAEQVEDTTAAAIADKTGTVFEVESVLRISDGTKAKRFWVSAEELRRRCSPPECFSANAVVAYVRKEKGQKNTLLGQLKEANVEPCPRIKLSTTMTKLCEEECVTLADDISYLASKFLPITRIAQACLEEENDGTHEAILKAENCRRTLRHLLKAMEANWAEYDLASHGLGPNILKGTFALIDSCLAEKMKLVEIKK